MYKRKASTFVELLIILPMILILSCAISATFNLTAILVESSESDIRFESAKEELIAELASGTDPYQLINLNKEYVIEIIGQTNDAYEINLIFDTFRGKKKGTIVWPRTK